jgi:hypothetical protein
MNFSSSMPMLTKASSRELILKFTPMPSPYAYSSFLNMPPRYGLALNGTVNRMVVGEDWGSTEANFNCSSTNSITFLLSIEGFRSVRRS